MFLNNKFANLSCNFGCVAYVTQNKNYLFFDKNNFSQIYGSKANLIYLNEENELIIQNSKIRSLIFELKGGLFIN